MKREKSFPSRSFEEALNKLAPKHRKALFVNPLAMLEREAIRVTLEHFNGDVVSAAGNLGIGKTTLYRKLKEYEITFKAVVE